MDKMKRLTKENCGEPISLDEVKLRQIQMLDALAAFCDEHGLRYYLDGGTLLGAVRHKGFIPWDDDIDVIIPHPDCLKLQELTGGRIGDFLIVPPTNDPPYQAESWKMYDPSTVIESDFGGASKTHRFFPVFLDLFQMEGLPDTEKETARWYRKTVLIRKFMISTEGSIWHGKTLIRKLLHLVMRPIAKLIGVKRLFRMLQASKERLNFDEANYVGNMSGPVHTTDSRVRKDEYTRPCKLEFEGKFYSVPGNYRQYLTQLYGADSMTTLPPESQRASRHSFQYYHYREK